MKSTNTFVTDHRKADTIGDIILRRELAVTELEKTLTAAAELHAEALQALIDLRRAAKDSGLDNRNLPGELDPGDFQVRVYEFFRAKSVGIPAGSLAGQVTKEHGALRTRLNRLGGK